MATTTARRMHRLALADRRRLLHAVGRHAHTVHHLGTITFDHPIGPDLDVDALFGEAPMPFEAVPTAQPAATHALAPVIDLREAVILHDRAALVALAQESTSLGCPLHQRSLPA